MKENPVDPRTLWRTFPTDAEAPYQVPDTATVSTTDVSGLTFAAASKRGRSHAQRGAFRDDSFASAWLAETGWFIAAVSDGAGSAPYSRAGSRIACETFVKDLSEKLASTETNDKWAACPDKPAQDKALGRLLLEAVNHAARLIGDEASANARKPNDYAATFLGYVVRRMETEWIVAAVGIGDGAIGLIDTQGEFRLLNEPEGGEFVGQTRFITSPEAWQNPGKYVRAVRVPGISTLISMTDGVSDPFFETDRELCEAARWQTFVRMLRGELDKDADDSTRGDRLLSWLDFYIAKHHDDRTITLLAGKGL